MDVPTIGVVEIHDFGTKGLILSRPSYKSPATVFPMPEHIDWEDLFDFVSRIKVVIEMIDVDDNEGTVIP